MPHSNESLSSDEGSDNSYESALATPLSPRVDSEDDMAPLLLQNQGADDQGAGRANPNPAAPIGQALLHRLALRVQAAAAGGPRDAGGANSPQLDPQRQQMVDQQMQQMQQPGQQVEQAQEQQGGGPAPEGGFKFRCKQCPARFTHLNLLTRHQNEMHPVTKPYVCPDCGRGYVIREIMEAHYLMVHRGERPYPCDQCEKVFSRREYLVTHSRVHTGFKPYLCGDCGRRFAWKGCIDIHRRTHTGERPYLCITCSRDFATLSTLKMHEMIHTNSFPHPCDVPECGRKFRRSYDLRMHMQDHEHEAGVAAGGELNNSRLEDEVAVAAVLNEANLNQAPVAV